MRRRGQHGALGVLVGKPGAARVDRNRVAADMRVGFLNVLAHDLRIRVDDGPGPPLARLKSSLARTTRPPPAAWLDVAVPLNAPGALGAVYLRS